MNKVWAPEAWDDYVWWQTQDRKTLKRINALIKDVERNGVDAGIGKPEPLRGDLSGFCSRRIDEKSLRRYERAACWMKATVSATCSSALMDASPSPACAP
ncbi:MAG: Txe/YoeB family addiction module toxin [Eggerthellaceae bacterium]|jgi:toxin YoeB